MSDDPVYYAPNHYSQTRSPDVANLSGRAGIGLGRNQRTGCSSAPMSNANEFHGLSQIIGEHTHLGGNEYVTGDRHSGFVRFTAAPSQALDVSISGDAISVRATLTSAADAKKLVAIIESTAAALFDREPKTPETESPAPREQEPG